MDAIRPIDINYNETRRLSQAIAQPRSLTHRVAAIAAIAFVAIVETLRNLIAYPINAGIWAFNRYIAPPQSNPQSNKPKKIETIEMTETPDASAPIDLPAKPLLESITHIPTPDQPPEGLLRYEPVESYEPVEGTPGFEDFMAAETAPKVEWKRALSAVGTAIGLTAKVTYQVGKLACNSILSCRRQKHVRFADVAQQKEFDSRQILPETRYPPLKA